MKARLLLGILPFALLSCQSSGQQKATAKTASSSAVGLAAEIVQPITEKRYNDLKPGDIAPDAVSLDVDEINAVINGVCVVTKGTQQALIDLNGKFIVPWGKYAFTVNEYSMPFTAFLKVEDQVTRKNGFINVKGQTVIPITYSQVDEFDHQHIARAVTKDFRYGIIDSKGGFYSVQDIGVNTHMSDRMLYREAQDENRYLTVNSKLFLTKTGKPAFTCVFDKAKPFTEGLAAAQFRDQFNNVKWGFIDRSGNIVIQPTYKNMPGSFHNGLAMVIPAEPTTFDYAFIDRKGVVKLKVGDGSKWYPSMVPGSFIGGYFTFKIDGKREDRLMDTTGTYRTFSEFIQDKSWRLDETGIELNGENDLGYLVTRTKYDNPDNQLGMIDRKGKVLFPLAFQKIVPDYYSPYAIAQVRNPPGAPKRSYDTYRRGIINSQGVYVMVIAEKSTF